MQVDAPGEENEGFDYDAVGNRLAQDGVEGEWTYNDNNELLTFTGTEYTYDENGSATRLLLNGAVMFSYHYNAQDRLVKVEDVNGSTIAEYAYDPFGRRLWKEVGGTHTYFFYADEGLVAEFDASGTGLKSYGYRPDSSWTTDPSLRQWIFVSGVSVVSSSRGRYLLIDGRGKLSSLGDGLPLCPYQI